MKFLNEAKNKAKYIKQGCCWFISRAGNGFLCLISLSPIPAMIGYAYGMQYAFYCAAIIFLLLILFGNTREQVRSLEIEHQRLKSVETERLKDFSYKPTQLWMQGDKRVFDIIESKLDELTALKEQVSKLTLQINELQNQNSKMKNENIQE